MKKLGYLFICLFIMFSFSYIFYALINDSKECYEVIYLNNNNSNTQKKYDFGCLNSLKEVDTCYIEINSLDELLSLYTIKQNSLPKNYYSPLPYDSIIEDFKLIENTLYVKINKIESQNLNLFIECLKITINKNYPLISLIELEIGLSKYYVKL